MAAVEHSIHREEYPHLKEEIAKLNPDMRYKLLQHVLDPFIGPKEFHRLATRYIAYSSEDVSIPFKIVVDRFKVFKKIYNINEDITIDDFITSLQNAKHLFLSVARFGFDGILRSIIRKKPKWLTDQLLGEALISASRSNRIDVVDTLLFHGNISVDFLTGAFNSAAAHGHTAIVETFLANKKFTKLPVADLGRVLASAAQNGHKAIVEMLLTNERFAEISDDHLVNALIVAAQNGYKDIIEILLARFSELPVADLGRVLASAMRNKHRDLVKTLLTTRFAEIPSIRVEDTIKIAARNGDKDIVEALLTYASRHRVWISGTNLGDALIAATQNGHEAIIEMLLAYASDHHSIEIPGVSVGNALIAAVQKGYKTIVEMFLANERFAEISEADLGNALNAAIVHTTGISEVLLAYVRDHRIVIQDHKLGRILTYASIKGNEALVEALLIYAKDIQIRMEQSFIELAINFAERKGYTIIVEKLKTFMRENSTER